MATVKTSSSCIVTRECSEGNVEVSVRNMDGENTWMISAIRSFSVMSSTLRLTDEDVDTMLKLIEQLRCVKS